MRKPGKLVVVSEQYPPDPSTTAAIMCEIVEHLAAERTVLVLSGTPGSHTEDSAHHRAFLSVENLSSFILQWLSRADENFDVFLVADKEQVSMPEFVERLAKAAGARPRLFAMPTPFLSALLRISGRWEAHDSLIGSLDISKAAAVGWRLQVTLDEGLRLALSGSDH
jgi:nucleoside-diphosphate-sugar epimerase